MKENVVFSHDSRSSEKFIHGIKVLMAKNYIDNLSEETKKGMLEKAEQGIYPSFAPLGYINVQCGDKRYIQPDPELAPIIRQLFEWYATGNHSLFDVARIANSEGLTYRKTGNKVGKSTVHKILTSPIYHGEFDWAGKHYRGLHEPIITRELFDRVHEILTEKGHLPETTAYARVGLPRTCVLRPLRLCAHGRDQEGTLRLLPLHRL